MNNKTVPIFPLDPTAEWEDLTNAMEASVQYRVAHGGQFGPLFAFAPLREPDDPDKWEPVTNELQNLLLVSIARAEDARLRQALAQAGAAVGPLVEAGAPGSGIEFRIDGLIAEVFAQMEAAGVTACLARQAVREDDVTFICVRGAAAVHALNKALGQLRRR